MTTHHNFLERDIITVNFDPSVRTEIKKRRPAIVISKNGYNKGHSQVIVCPITSTTKDSFFFGSIDCPVIQDILKPGSKVNTSQVFTLDVTPGSTRNPLKIGQLVSKEFLNILQFVMLNFNHLTD